MRRLKDAAIGCALGALPVLMVMCLTGCPFGEVTQVNPCLVVERPGTVAERGCQIKASGCPQPPFNWSLEMEVKCAGDHDIALRLDKSVTSHCLTKAAYRALCFVEYADGYRKGTAGCPRFPVDGCGKFVVR